MQRMLPEGVWRADCWEAATDFPNHNCVEKEAGGRWLMKLFISTRRAKHLFGQSYNSRGFKGWLQPREEKLNVRYTASSQFPTGNTGSSALFWVQVVLALPSASGYSYCLQAWHRQSGFDPTQQSSSDVRLLAPEEFAPPLLLHRGIKQPYLHGQYCTISLPWIPRHCATENCGSLPDSGIRKRANNVGAQWMYKHRNLLWRVLHLPWSQALEIPLEERQLWGQANPASRLARGDK